MSTRIVLFCGGRGSATIIRALLRQTDVELTLIVNAYNDGLSTGALRSFIPGMLGPSDFRKNFSYLLDLYSDEQYALKNLIEFRLPATFGPDEVRQLHTFAAGGRINELSEPLHGLFGALGAECSTHIGKLLKVFLDYANYSARRFDFRDCALGN